MQLSGRNPINKNSLIVFVFIMVLGSLLRFYGLGDQSLWNDELSSWKRSSYHNLSTVIDEGVRSDVHPPGYHVFLYFIEKYIGDSESKLRFSSAISGVLSIFVIFLIGIRLYSYKEGLIASAFMAVSWCPIYHSQNARSYSMLLLFTLLATYFWISILSSLRDRGKASYPTTVGYITAAIISSYLHYFGLYLVLLQGLAAALFLVRGRKMLYHVLLIYAPIVLAYLPWLPIMYEQLSRGSIWIGPSGSITASFYDYLNYLFNKSRKLELVVLMLYSFLIARGLYNIWKLKDYKMRGMAPLFPSLLLVLWLIVPFTGVYVKSILSAPILTYRNLIISLPAAYLLLSRSITQLPLRSRNTTIVAIAIVCLVLFHLTFRMEYYSKPYKQQFREAVQYIVERDNSYKESLIIGFAWHQDYFNYYFEKRGSTRRIKVMGGQDKDIFDIAKVIDTEKPPHVWYIRGHRKPDPRFMDFLYEKLALIDHRKFIGAEVWLFERKIEAGM